MVRTYSKKSQGSSKISDSFKVAEFACKDGTDAVLIDVDFVKEKLQKIRNWAGAAVTITSGYRTASYNKKVGGATNSYHVKGRAFDIKVKGKTLDEVCCYAESIGILGIIRYPASGFVHLDSRTSRYYSKDSGKTSCATFGGAQSTSYTVGRTYVLLKELKVRSGPGTNYAAKTHDQLTTGGKNSDKDKDGCLDKGTKITCKEVRQVGSDIWIRCPSGWIAAVYQGNRYVE